MRRLALGVLAAAALLSGPGRAAAAVYKVYWSEAGESEPGSIRRANADGSGVETLLEGLYGPMGVALDTAAGKIYWAEVFAGKIRRANLNGSGIEDVVTAGVGYPQGIALDLGAGEVYWTDVGNDQIKRADLDGSGVEVLVETDSPYALLALDAGGGKMYWSDRGLRSPRRARPAGNRARGGPGSIRQAVRSRRGGGVCRKL